MTEVLVMFVAFMVIPAAILITVYKYLQGTFPKENKHGWIFVQSNRDAAVYVVRSTYFGLEAMDVNGKVHTGLIYPDLPSYYVLNHKSKQAAQLILDKYQPLEFKEI